MSWHEIAAAKQEELQETELVLKEGIISGERLDILGDRKSATNVGDVADHAILLFIVFRQFLVALVTLGKKTLADDGVDFLCTNVDAFVETVGHLRDGVAVDLCRIDDIIELLLGNTNCPYMFIETP